MNIGISACSYTLGSDKVSLPTLAQEKKLTSPAETMHSFGFKNIRRVNDKQDSYDLILKATQKLFKKNKIDPAKIDAILYTGAIFTSSLKHEDSLLPLFKYPAPRLQYELNMSNAVSIGIGQQGCSALFSALKMGYNMLSTDKSTNAILCVSGDVLSPNVNREVIYNVLSDGACAVLLEKNTNANTLLTFKHITKGYYWNVEKMESYIIASYFPTAKALINQTLNEAGITIDQLNWIIPHNVSLRSWKILCGLLGYPIEKVFTKNISAIGHCIGADNIINLTDALESKVIKKDDLVLLFNFGFGSNWSSILMKA